MKILRGATKICTSKPTGAEGGEGGGGAPKQLSR